MYRSRPTVFLIGMGLFSCAGHAAAQDVDLAPKYLLDEVMPGADRFDPAEGNPPVKRAYRGAELLGYVFLTSDLPPEEDGYSGPIRALVGMGPDGVLTGVRVTEYHESRMYDWGDFLRDPPWFQDQFAGKYVGDRFRVRGDVDGISQVTITVRAVATGVRNAARRVAAAYLTSPRPASVPISQAEVASMSWYDMQRRGVAATMLVTEEGKDPVRITLLHLTSEDFGQYLLGRIYGKIPNAVAERGGADYEVLYVVDGRNPRLSMEQGWSIEQGGRTVPIPPRDVVSIGAPGGGLLLGETTMVGVILLDEREARIDQPLTFVFNGGLPELGPFRVDYTSQVALTRMAEAAAGTAPSAPASRPPDASAATATSATASAPAAALTASSKDAAPTASATDEAAAAPATDETAAPASATDEAAAAASATDEAAAAAPARSPEDLVRFDFGDQGDEGYLESVSWSRVGWTVFVLVLAALAFFTKNVALRWVSLAATFVVLGWVDGGFLSVSHITGVIWVGPSAILSDLPLLIMVVFTLVTTLLWGRVFCGFLCPFGALQDFIDRVVPRRFKRELPKGAHRIALKAKYGILAVILIPAIAGAQVSLYQYFEPFGTVFFLSRSILLWAIAGSLLVASVVVPRFYCRYACPLGAALAVGSTISLRRIPRIEQCDYCKVCEHRCPTGAIDGPALDFKECVRCNDCEIQLIERRGVCKHDMEVVRSRLVHLGSRVLNVVETRTDYPSVL
jgi:4Fe-4S binding domain/FMN-binding domain